MTIHVRAWAGGDENAPEEPTLQVSISGLPDLRSFKEILDRALNCAPDFHSDWFSLCDSLYNFLNNLEKK